MPKPYSSLGWGGSALGPGLLRHGDSDPLHVQGFLFP